MVADFDDTVDVTMDWGFRRWISRSVCMKAFYAFLGKEAFNQTEAPAGYFTLHVSSRVVRGGVSASSAR